MSQHISGNVGQILEHEFGEFIIVNELRVRKSLIQAYNAVHFKGQVTTDGPGGNPVGPDGLTHGVALTIMNSGRIFIPCPDSETADKEVAKLDWLFKKDYGHNNGQSQNT